MTENEEQVPGTPIPGTGLTVTVEDDDGAELHDDPVRRWAFLPKSNRHIRDD